MSWLVSAPQQRLQRCVFGLAVGNGDEPAFSLDDLGTRHVARASAEPGFAVLPASVEVSFP